MTKTTVSDDRLAEMVGDGMPCVPIMAGEVAQVVQELRQRRAQQSVPAELHGPYGWLNGHRALSEESWTIEMDPLENSEEYFAIPLYALSDPFKEIAREKSIRTTAAVMDVIAQGTQTMNPKIAGDVRDCLSDALSRMAELEAERDAADKLADSNYHNVCVQQGQINDLTLRAEKAEALIAELAEALEPFANYKSPHDHLDIAKDAYPILTIPELTFGDFRRARAAIAKARADQ